MTRQTSGNEVRDGDLEVTGTLTAGTVSSPALTGTPTAPTASVGTDSTQIATTEFVNAEIANDAVLNSVLTDKGSLIAASGSATPADLPVGSDGQILVADSGESVGVGWVNEIAPSQVTGTAVVDNDSRLSDARTPTAHATSHEDGGSDELTLAQSQVTGLVSDLAQKAATSATLTVASHTNTAASFAGLPNTFFAASGGNRAHPASTILVWPFVVTDPITVTDWVADVRTNTSAATETLRAGIYNLSAGYVVGSLVLEFPTLTVPTGTGLYVTALSSPLNLASGRYAIAWNVSASTFTLKTPQTVFGTLRMDQTNNASALFLAGSNGSAPIANPLPDPVPTTQIVIATDTHAWGPSVLLVWSYT